MSTGWNQTAQVDTVRLIINLLGNEYWLELSPPFAVGAYPL